jgi:hypothetical protein
MVARELMGKMNQRDYKFYVVADGKIESGWESRDDAKDALTEDYGSGRGTKVLQERGLAKLGLNPDRDKDWVK